VEIDRLVKDPMFRLPPVPVRKHVRCLETVLHLNKGSFDALSRLASSFPALQQVVIRIGTWWPKTPEMRNAMHKAVEAAPSICFNTKTSSVQYYSQSMRDGFG
jgi:hypothetical protein